MYIKIQPLQEIPIKYIDAALNEEIDVLELISYGDRFIDHYAYIAYTDEHELMAYASECFDTKTNKYYNHGAYTRKKFRNNNMFNIIYNTKIYMQKYHARIESKGIYCIVADSVLHKDMFFKFGYAFIRKHAHENHPDKTFNLLSATTSEMIVLPNFPVTTTEIRPPIIEI